MTPRIPGTFAGLRPAPAKRDLSPEGSEAEQMMLNAGVLHAERWIVGPCTVMVTRDPLHGEYRWHVSIAHPLRYPTWDEIKVAAFSIPAVDNVMLAQVFTPGDKSPWINQHRYCLHLMEVHDDTLRRVWE